MTVSIIIPVYNVEKWLPYCLDSIIRQSFCDWELILVDDGSKDESGIICDEYAHRDNRIIVIHKENQGVSAARNEGIRNAQGTWITFIDSDDRIKPDYLSKFSYNTNVDFEIQGFTLTKGLDNKGFRTVTFNKTKTTSLKDAYCEAELMKLSRGPVCKLFKREIIIKNRIEFPTDIHFGEDAIFVKRYLLHCDINRDARAIASGDYLYNYHDGESLTKRRHKGEAIYTMATIDYDLFIKLQKKWGTFPQKLIDDFTRIRTLEFYQSIILYFSEKHSYMDQKNYLFTIKNGFYQMIKRQKNLPLTYKIIRGVMSYCPLYLAVFVLRPIALNSVK